jgi:hypothetical protein
MTINLMMHRSAAAHDGATSAGTTSAGTTGAGTTGAGIGPARGGRRRAWLTVPGLTGIGYTLSWLAGLAVPAPSPRLGASGAEVVAALAGHGPAVAAQFALTEGLPAIGIAVISVALARFARRRGGRAAARFALASGLVAAAISAGQAVLGVVLAATTAPGAAHLLYASADRLDGVKMLALAVLGAAAAATAVLPRWLRWTAAGLAVAITGSGLVYLLLAASLAAAAGPALVLLLAFMTGCGIMIGMRTDPRDR